MLIAVAHGSRDPRSAAAVRELVAALPGARPAFLDLSEPLLTDVLADVGDGEAVVVPLLLGSAYHALVDIPEMVDKATTVPRAKAGNRIGRLDEATLASVSRALAAFLSIG